MQNNVTTSHERYSKGDQFFLFLIFFLLLFSSTALTLFLQKQSHFQLATNLKIGYLDFPLREPGREHIEVL